MITVLSLDTSSRFASISIAKGEDIRLEYNFAAWDDLSETLISSLDSVLNNAQGPLKLEDIDLFGVGIGPGLFTGIRVGMATLKGLLLGTGKPVVPVITLEAAAYKCDEPGLPVVSMIDAKRKEVYIAIYRFADLELLEISPPELIPIDRLNERLAPAFKPGEEFYVVGSAAAIYSDTIRRDFNRARVLGRSCFLAPEISKIAYRRYMKNDYITDLRRLNPFYIRKPDAEQNYARTQGNS